jgi:hypothetical protein
MKFRNKDELKAWLDDIAEEHAQLTAERMIADGCDIDEVDEFIARWVKDAERRNEQIVVEIERVVDERDAPTHSPN